MPTLEELRIKHRWDERSVAQMVDIPEAMTEQEHEAFLVEQRHWNHLTNEGQREGWLRRGLGQWPSPGDWFVPRVQEHPTRMVAQGESDADYEIRMAALRTRVSRGIDDRMRAAYQMLGQLEKLAGQELTLDRAVLRQACTDEVTRSMGAEQRSLRLTRQVADTLTPDEKAVASAGAAAWTALRKRGLNEGWLIRKEGFIQTRELLHHPYRTHPELEDDAVWMSRCDGLDAYIRARITDPAPTTN